MLSSALLMKRIASIIVLSPNFRILFLYLLIIFESTIKKDLSKLAGKNWCCGVVFSTIHKNLQKETLCDIQLSSLATILDQLSLNSCSVQVHILYVACWRFAKVRISDNGPGWK